MPKNWLEADWPAPANIRAVTTLRIGGVSLSPYHSLNPATHVGDNPEHVATNRTLLAEMLALPSAPAWLEQVHGDTVLAAENITGMVQADASYSAKRHVVCTVMTADCLPALFCSTDGEVIAAAHAGWRGLLAGILSKTYLRMQKPEVLVWLGPAIGPKAFEVGPEVKAAFCAKNPDFAAAFKSKDSAHFLADIYQLARIELATQGILNIYGGGYCTYSDAERFFSYRREAQTGRLASLIWKT